MSGGAIGESLILDFTKYMNKLIDFEVAEPDALVQVLGSPRDYALGQTIHKSMQVQLLSP